MHVVFLALGGLVLLVAWLPLAAEKLPLSLPIVCVGLGLASFWTGLLAVQPGPLLGSAAAETVLELVLLIALMGAGLKIDRPFNIRRWAVTWRLIGIAMPLTIAATAVLARFVGEFSWPAALLVGSMLSPTDPVLASDVEVGGPGVGEEGEVRFGLTSEAAVNDGLAFPFVSLAVVLAAGADVGPHWLAVHFLWKVGLGFGLGWGFGRALGWLTFRLPYLSFSNTGSGMIALGLALSTFGVVEMLGGYGFLAVFVSALSLRAACPESEFNKALADFADQLQRLLVMIVLVAFGAAVAAGLLAALTWADVAIGLALLFLVRPASALLSLVGSPHPPIAKAATAFFGIRGIGTLYYLVYALHERGFDQPGRLAALVGFVVLCSVVLHGLTATPAMRRVDRVQARSEAEAER